MACLEVNLLASFQVTLNGRLLTNFGTDKTRALLAYLTVERDHPHRRESLAALLWPEQPDKQARHSLRQALTHLRHALEDHDDSRAYLLIDRHDVWLNPEANVHVDVAQFTTLADACASHDHRHIAACRPCLQRLERMITLYRGDFLAGFIVTDSTLFAEWALLKREWLHRQAIEALTYLADYAERRDDVKAARHYAQQQVDLEPWREEAHRQLIRLLAQAGQRSAALAQFAACRTALAQELEVSPTAETDRLYQLIRDDTRLPPVATPPLHLPLMPTPFSGRVAERAALADLLAAPDSRLITLTGPGGIGKSRLALQVASEQHGLHADGIFWVDLSDIGQAAHIMPALAQALRLTLHGSEPAQRQLLAFLRHKSLLLVLDGVEHLPELAEQIAPLLAAAPEIIFLVTSRQRLGLREERLFGVEGLTYGATAVSSPDATNQTSRQNEAFAFLRQQLERQTHHFQPGQADVAALHTICRLVDGMPLALELAAVAIAERGCTAVARALESGLDLLTSAFHNVPARQRSIRATFAHSWSLLTEKEGLGLARLAIFQGSFTAAAAQAVAATDQATLTRLLAKSLLHHGGNGRYRLHTLLRQFATEKLTECEAMAAETAVAHATHYTLFLAEQEDKLKGMGQEDALQAIDAELPNIRRAWQWAIDHLGQSATATDLLHNSLESLYQYYCLRSWYEEGAALFAQAVAAARSLTPPDERLLGHLLARQARCLEFTAPAAEASQLYRQSLAIFEQLDAPQAAALPLYGLGYMAHLRGAYETANDHFQDSLAHYEAANDQWGMATVLSGLSLNRRRQGAFAAARRAGEQSLAIRRAIGDRRGVASSQNNLGLILCALGAYEAAEAALRESAAICEAIGHTVGTANACTGLVQVAMQQGDVAAALGYQEKAQDLYRQVGDVWGVAIAYNNLGKIHLLNGDLAAACALFSQAVATYRQADVPGGLASALGNWGEACLQMGDLPGAADYFAEALALAADIGDWPVALDVVVKTAVLYHQQTGAWAQPLLLLTFALRQPALLAETRRIVEKTVAAWESDAPPATQKTAAQQAEHTDWRGITEMVDLLLTEVKS